MPSDTQPIGPRLRALRTAGGLSLRTVAVRAGMIGQHLDRIEREIDGRPRPETVRRVAEALASLLAERREADAALARQVRALARETSPTTPPQ